MEQTSRTDPAELPQLDVAATPDPRHLVLYDGICALCQGSVRWILARDRAGEFAFAPLQGPTAAELAERHPEVAAEVADPTSWLLVRDAFVEGREPEILLRSTAVVAMLGILGGFWRLPHLLGRLVPRPLRDAVYRLISRNRYGWFGTVEKEGDACPLPAPEHRGRFLP